MKYASAVRAISLGLLLVGIAPAADSLNVRLVGSLGTPGEARHVDVRGGYAYVGVCPGGLRICSVSDPMHPTEVGHCDSTTYSRAVVVVDDVAYVADGLWLRTVSVADPAHPVQLGRCLCDTTYGAYNLAVAGNLAYVAVGGHGFRIVSVADPAQPVVVGRYDSLYIGAVAVVGNCAYVAANTDGLHVMSVADPAHPVDLGHCRIPTWSLDVAVEGDYAYLVGDSGLTVVSVADSTQPVEVGSLRAFGNNYGIALSGSYAYIADGRRLHVVSIADPAHPVEAGYYNWPAGPAWAYGVVEDGGYVYVADGFNGLQICQFYGAGVQETMNDERVAGNAMPTILSGASYVKRLASSVVFDAMGRRVVNPRSGVYFVREAQARAQAQAIRKVVIQR